MYHSLPPDDPSLGLVQYVAPDGTLVGDLPAVEPKLLVRMLREMLRVRLLDQKLLGSQRQGKVGFYGSITGQEAVPVAAGLAALPEDWVFPALRESAMMLVRGFPLELYVAQVFGNDADLLKGRQMPSHMSGRQVNQVSWSSCIGPQLPQAVGAAMAARLRADPIVTLGFMGDGATSTPDFHTAMNFAGLFRPPCVLICQNNHWSISVPTAQQTASPTLAAKAYAYGIRPVRVDGNDVIAVYLVLLDAIERARTGAGPTFIEAVTYRIGPHSSSDDPTRYRDQAEVDAWVARDPIVRMAKLLTDRGLLDDDARVAMERELKQEIDAAVSAVESRPAPARQTMFEDVFADRPWHLAEQLAASERGSRGQ